MIDLALAFFCLYLCLYCRFCVATVSRWIKTYIEHIIVIIIIIIIIIITCNIEVV